MLSDEQFSQEVKSKSYVVKQMTDILNNPNFKNLRENLKNDRKKKMIITFKMYLEKNFLRIRLLRKDEKISQNPYYHIEIQKNLLKINIL